MKRHVIIFTATLALSAMTMFAPSMGWAQDAKKATPIGHGDEMAISHAVKTAIEGFNGHIVARQAGSAGQKRAIEELEKHARTAFKECDKMLQTVVGGRANADTDRSTPHHRFVAASMQYVGTLKKLASGSTGSSTDWPSLYSLNQAVCEAIDVLELRHALLHMEDEKNKGIQAMREHVKEMQEVVHAEMKSLSEPAGEAKGDASFQNLRKQAAELLHALHDISGDDDAGKHDHTENKP